MTVIAAVAKGNAVTVGSDSVAINGSTLVYKNESKILEFFDGESGSKILVAAAGNASVMPVLAHSLKFDTPPALDASDSEADEWAIATAHAITACLADCNPPMLTGAGEDPACLDSQLMMAVGRHLWLIFTNAVIRPRSGVVTLGSGGDLALGVLLTSERHGVPPEQAVADAVNLASIYSDGCRVDERGPRIHSTAQGVHDE